MALSLLKHFLKRIVASSHYVGVQVIVSLVEKFRSVSGGQFTLFEEPFFFLFYQTSNETSQDTGDKNNAGFVYVRLQETDGLFCWFLKRHN